MKTPFNWHWLSLIFLVLKLVLPDFITPAQVAGMEDLRAKYHGKTIQFRLKDGPPFSGTGKLEVEHGTILIEGSDTVLKSPMLSVQIKLSTDQIALLAPHPNPIEFDLCLFE